MLNSIRGFCHLASRRLANKRPKQLKNGTYKYCKEVEASIEGLKTAATNLSVNCLEMAARSYLHREAAYYIHELCQTTKRIAGTPTGTVFWREQDLLHQIDIKEDKCPLVRVVQGEGVQYLTQTLRQTQPSVH